MEAYTTTKIEVGDHRVVYGDDPSQFGELFLPTTASKALPVLVLIHGGCWRAEYGLGPVGQFARAISNKGIAVWSLEYRRLGNGGGWPNTFLDVAHGADKLRDLALEFNLDLSRVVVSGHSAGGHLALWSAARGLLPKDSPIYTPDPLTFTSVVALAPVCDLERALSWDICIEAVNLIVGGRPRQVYRNYRQGSPSALLPLGIRHVTFNGTDDDIVPIEYVEPFVTAAVRSGDDAQLISVPNVGHFEIVLAKHPAGQLVIETILAEFSS